MKTNLFALFPLFTLLLVANCVLARKDAGEYWRGVMKDQPMPKAIQGLVHVDSAASSTSTQKTNCHPNENFEQINNEVKKYAKNIEPEPNVSVYDNDLKPTKDKLFAKESNPGHDATIYHSNNAGLKVEKFLVKDSWPNALVYGNDIPADLKEKKIFAKDFEPGPNISVYDNDVPAGLKEKKIFAKDFEPGPNISVYDNDVPAGLKEKKIFAKDFEPGPNISVYDNDVPAGLEAR